MMTLLSIAATFQCEGCGEKFNVDIPLLDRYRPGECAMDLARARLVTIEDDAPHSYIAETVLCEVCTRTIDEKSQTASDAGGPLERCELTRVWILRQLLAIGGGEV